MSNLLLDEHPLIVLPTLATVLGLNEAIVLQQIHYWAIINRQAKREDTHYRKERWWTYNTYSDWQEQLPFLSERTIRRALDHLVEMGAACKDRFNQKAYDKTNWYSVNHDGLARFVAEATGNGTSERLAKVDSPSGQSDQIDVANLARPIPETTKDYTDPLPQRAAAADEGPQYVEIDEDGVPVEDSKPKVHKWMVPELDIHHKVLKACGAKRFRRTRMKSRLTGLAQAVAAGDVLGKGAYQACVDGLNGNDKMAEPLPPIPASWVPWRLAQARDHRWSVPATVRALFNRDVLVTHCHYHLKRMGVPVPQAALEEHEFPGATTYK